MMEFFLPMIPPTVTEQQHRQKKLPSGRYVTYDTPELADAKQKFLAYLAPHVPERMYTGGVRLTTVWCFPVTGEHRDGEYKTTKPDTDNLQKAFKDCMTKLRFWKDDALVASEFVEKFYAGTTGVYVKIEELPK